MIKPINKVEVKFNDASIGTIALTPDGLCAFEYTAEYLVKGVSISPFYLPLKPGVFISRREPFLGNFGIFNDSLPDGWGQLLTDRLLKKNGINLSDISLLHRLCLVGNSGIGALSYQPQIELTQQQDKIDLEQIALEVEKILQNNFEGKLEELYQKGGSSGGARPKIFYKKDSKNWIVKFKSSIDPVNIGWLEYEYSKAAKACGIIMPETQLFENKYFGVQRFDISDKGKYLIHSASGLLYASHRYPSLDYIDLIKATLALTKNMNEALKLFRQMVFNVLTFNKDDHAKNFSFLLKEKNWELSPAYDLVYSEGLNSQHTSTINGKGNPEKDDLFEVAKQTSLPKNQVKSIFNEVSDNITGLLKILKSEGLG